MKCLSTSNSSLVPRPKCSGNVRDHSWKIQAVVSYPDPFFTAADGLHHRYVKSMERRLLQIHTHARSLLSVVNSLQQHANLLTRPLVASVEKGLASVSVSSARVWVSLASVGVSLASVGVSFASVGVSFASVGVSLGKSLARVRDSFA